MLNLDTKNILQSRLYALNPWITELSNFIGVGQDNVVMLLILERLFKVRRILTELVFANQVAIQQELDGVVERGPAHRIALLLHLSEKCFHIKMSGKFINLAKNSEALWGFPVLVSLQISRKDGSYFFLQLNG